MIRVVSFNFQGAMYPLFIDDTETGYNGKDVLSKPGVYDELCNEQFSLPIASLQGAIDGYATKCMGLLAVVEEGGEAKYPIQDCTSQVKQLLTVPETAAKMLLSRESDEARVMLETALEVIHYYEQVTEDTKVFLPEEAFQFIEEDVAKKMRSKRHVYVLKSSDNQEILARDCTSVYGVVLPPVEDLHSDSDVAPSALDILRVIAPCRRESSQGVYQYSGIYHTPYFRVDPKLRGLLPSYLNFLNGFPKNDLLGIQSNERHMYDNLYIFICADIARYVGEIVTGVFFTTQFGQSIKRFLACHNEELLTNLASSLAGQCDEWVSCNITYAELQELSQEGYSHESLSRLVKKNLTVSVDYLFKMLEEQSKYYHVVDIENLPFVLDLSDEDKESLTGLLISKSVISRAMLDYILALCMKAYEVNWGHSGAARAIPRFVLQPGIEHMNEVLGAYLNQRLSNMQTPTDMDFSVLFETTNKSDEEDDEGDDDEVFTTFDYYITNDTAYKVRANTLSPSFFSGGVTGAETSEAAIVEYWRKVNGESELSYFISSSFTAIGGVHVLIECFIKLMRWGSVKPSILVLHDFPSIRTVFDLNTGKEIPNTAIVDESQLILSNGCRYSLCNVLTAQDIVGSENAIVGFLLAKDYGVKKYTLASWVDIGEMVDSGEIDIDALKSVTQIDLTGESVKDIGQYENSGYQLFTSTHNIELGLQYNIAPSSLSELSLLLTPGILRSPEYLKSKQSSMVITTKDRQYQILATYCNVLRSVYGSEGETLKAEKISTADISAIAVKVYRAFKAGGKTQAPDVNSVRASAALNNMNLDMGGIKFCDDELVGKFTIISDMEMQSSFPSIEFTDSAMREVAKKVRDRVVLLMLETADAFIFCRKSIASTELLVVDHKIEHRKYATFTKVIQALRMNQPVHITNPKTQVRKPAKLHRSLAEYI